MKKTVLLIEDEAPLQKTLEDALTSKELGLISALDGEIGIRLAKQKKPDLILLDLKLPGISGIQVCKKLKGDEETKDIPIIVLTNVEDMESTQEAIELGAVAYLVKINHNLGEIVEKVRRALQDPKVPITDF